jgi:SAM-dependent methyltransferase
MTEWWQEFFLSGCYTLLEEIPPERSDAQTAFMEQALALEAGALLLDVACGIGRHSRRFAARGFRVIGLDYTPSYLLRARAESEFLPLCLVRGDMRRLPFPSAVFDGAINVFTSFGYFESDAENADVIGEIGRVLRSGGVFLLDTIHRDGLIRRFQEDRWHEITGGYLLERTRWDSRSGRTPTEWTFLRGGETRAFSVNVRAYTCPEVTGMMEAAGMRVEEVWGDWEGGELGLESRRLIVKARKV